MKRRILLVIPNLGRGGAQHVFRQQFHFLSADYEVMGCVFNWDGSFDSDHHTNIVSLNVQAGRNYFTKAINFLIRIKRLQRIKKQNNISISISHLEGADYVNALSRSRAVIVCWLHGTKIHDKNISGLIGVIRMRLLIPVLYKRATKLVAVSNGIMSEFIKIVPGLNSKIITIYNGVDIQKLREQANELIPDEHFKLFLNYKIIITHCRLSLQKNLPALLKIFSLIENRSQLKLVIVGDGELRDDLFNYSSSLNLKVWMFNREASFDETFHVYFIGQQSNPFKYLRHASLYAMTSGWEGFPLSLCEALACRLPVIASDCFTGPREILAPEIDLPQPLERPYQTSRGVLMPLADIHDDERMMLWAQEMENMLIYRHDFQESDLDFLDLRNNRMNTLKLLNDIMK